jgi:hypothetical protein
MLSWYCFQIFFFRSLVTIPVAPMITGITKHFVFHISRISILKFLYFNFFSDSCITFLLDGIATSISKQILSFMFLIIISGLFSRTSLSVCTPWFHSTVISSCWHTGLGMWEYQFSVVSMPNVLHIEYFIIIIIIISSYLLLKYSLCSRCICQM